MSSVTWAVIVGLAVGIAFIGIFAGMSNWAPLGADKISPSTNSSVTANEATPQVNQATAVNTTQANPTSSVSSQEKYPTLIVLRMGNDTQRLGDHYTVYSVSNQNISRYPQVLHGLKYEDGRFVNQTNLCRSSPFTCYGLQGQRFNSPLYLTLSPDTVRLLMADPAFHFRQSPGLPSSFQETQVDVNGTVYSIDLQCKTTNCG